MAGLPFRMGTATTIIRTTVVVIEKGEMIQVFRAQYAFSDRFVSDMLSRNIVVEQDLVDQLFNSTEKRLTRTPLLAARYGKQDRPQELLQRCPKRCPAEMVGATGSRVNIFLNKFRKLGFVGDKEAMRVSHALLNVVPHD